MPLASFSVRFRVVARAIVPLQILIACCIFATSLPHARAQSTPVAPALSAPAPEAVTALYDRLDSWIRNWSIPTESPATQTPALNPPPGIAITLRVSGRIVGRGQDLSATPESLWNAARKAMREAEGSLRLDPSLQRDRLTAVGQAVEITLEVAGTFVPFAAPTYTDVDLGIRAGLDGIAARLDDKTVAIFPANSLVAGFQPSDALRAAISDVTGDPNLAIDAGTGGQPGSIAKSHRVTYYRFRTTTLAQAASGERPLFTHRGGRIIPAGEMTRPALSSLAADMTRHLIARSTLPGPPPNTPTSNPTTTQPVAGLLVPTREQPVAATASRFELALAAFALSRAHVEPALKTQADAQALLFAQRIIQSAANDATPLAHAEAAMILLALSNTPPDPSAATLLDRCRTTLADSYHPDSGWATETSGTGRGLIAYAFCIAARDDAERALASHAVRSLFRDTPPGLLIGHMPWLGWAELLVTAQGAAPAAADSLREMRDQVYTHQIRDEDAEAPDADLVGGFVFTASASPFPTWQSSRAMPFLATMLADPTLTDDAEILKYLARGLSSMRFLRQLTADTVAGHMYPARGLALGGVRAAVWDQRQPIEATAMGLLSVSETLRAMDAITPRLRPPGTTTPAQQPAPR